MSHFLRNLITAIFLCFINIYAIAQTASQKSTNETCGCVKKINPSTPEAKRTEQAFGCMLASLQKYMPQLKKEYNIQIADEQEAAKAVARNVGGKLAKDCPEMAVYFLKMAEASQQTSEDGKTVPDISTDTLKLDSKICANFKTGKYKSDKMYMNKKLMENPDATAYSEIKDGFVYDYSENKKNVTKWSLRWINGCEWEQTLLESSDPSINGVFKKGDKITIKAIGSTKNGGLYITSKMMGMDFILLISKLK